MLIIDSPFAGPGNGATHVNASLDAVGPSRLFSVAEVRLRSAADAIRPESEFAPSVTWASHAISQAKAGINALRSILVPGTSFDVRRRASTAIDFAEAGTAALRRYHDGMLKYGGDPVRMTSLGELRWSLDRAVRAFDIAADRAASGY